MNRQSVEQQSSMRAWRMAHGMCHMCLMMQCHQEVCSPGPMRLQPSSGIMLGPWTAGNGALSKQSFGSMNSSTNNCGGMRGEGLSSPSMFPLNPLHLLTPWEQPRSFHPDVDVAGQRGVPPLLVGCERSAKGRVYDEGAAPQLCLFISNYRRDIISLLWRRFSFPPTAPT